MSIQTLTSEPRGLPDAQELARLANQFFSSLPSSASSVSSPSLPSGFNASDKTANNAVNTATSSASPQNLVLAGGSAPSLIPSAPAGNGVPDTFSQGLPGVDGRLGGLTQRAPQAYEASILPAGGLGSTPTAPASSAPVPSTPYYFLGEASGYPSTAPKADDVPVVVDDRISAQSFGLPGGDELLALLTGDARPNDATSKNNMQKSHDGYYFLELNDLNHALAGKTAATETQRQSKAAPFDINAIRRDFPILKEKVNGKPLAWFDNAATTHKPQSVIDRIAYFYAHENSNIHRAAHELAARATDAYESARNKVTKFIGAASSDEIIFVRGATEAINLIAKTWGAQNIGEGDEIIVSNLEHHANIVPWQQLAAAKGAKIRVIPVDDRGQVILSEYAKLLNSRTKIVSVTQVSNALGTVVPVKEIIALAHQAGAIAVVDGAQSVSHMRVNVQALDADFFVFSGHKVFAPTGIGVVYGKRALLDQMPPWQGGGNMIADVTFDKTVFQPAPNKFEAGTGNIADAVGLGAAIDYVERIGIEKIAQYEHDLLEYATHYLKPIKGVRLIGTAADKASVLSFVLEGYSTEEVGRALNEEGIAVRSGHHCAQPILRRFGVEATVRPSFAFYNTCEEIDRFIAVIRRLSAARS